MVIETSLPSHFMHYNINGGDVAHTMLYVNSLLLANTVKLSLLTFSALVLPSELSKE